MIVEHVSNRIQLGLMISVAGILVVVCVVVISTCSDCDPKQSLDVDDGQFPV